MKLSPQTEEVATFFAKMLDHEYTTKDIFRKNFFKDWRKVRASHCSASLSTPNDKSTEKKKNCQLGKCGA